MCLPVCVCVCAGCTLKFELGKSRACIHLVFSPFLVRATSTATRASNASNPCGNGDDPVYLSTSKTQWVITTTRVARTATATAGTATAALQLQCNFNAKKVSNTPFYLCTGMSSNRSSSSCDACAPLEAPASCLVASLPRLGSVAVPLSLMSHALHALLRNQDAAKQLPVPEIEEANNAITMQYFVNCNAYKVLQNAADYVEHFV